MKNNNEIKTKVYWNLKGYTKKMCPHEDLLETWYWPKEDYERGTELMVWINPILVNRQWFEAEINVSHRRLAVEGKRHTKIDGEWTTVPSIIPAQTIYGRIEKEDRYTLNMTDWNRPFHELSSDIVKICIDGFAYGREKFLEIFRNENVNCT